MPHTVDPDPRLRTSEGLFDSGVGHHLSPLADPALSLRRKDVQSDSGRRHHAGVV